VPPSIVWGIGVGLAIAAIDTASLVLAGMSSTSQWPISVSDIDFLANVVLYTLVGFWVGKSTGIVRDAAEAGVLAGVLVAGIGIAATYVLRPATGTIDTPNDVIAIVAQNVAIGGVLGILGGWLGSRAAQDRPASRR
jgi:hypothetical protein